MNTEQTEQEPAIKNSERLQASRDFGVESTGAAAPRPVSFSAFRQIHARFRAESQHVLQRNDCCVRHGRKHRADKVPMNLLAVAVQIVETKLPLTLDLFGGAG